MAETKEVQQLSEISAMIAGGQAMVRIENDSMQQLAIQKPRPPLKQIINACIDELQMAPEFAQSAYYSIPYKEKADQGEGGTVKMIEGNSIKAAKMMQRHMRNISSGAREIDDTGDKVIVQGAAVDLETNTRTVREKAVSRWAVGKGGQRYMLRQERFELAVEAAKSKAERNALLALMPEPLKMQVFITAKEIAAQKIGAQPGKKTLPLKERIQVALTKFATVGLTRELLIKFMQQRGKESVPEKWSEVDLGDIVGVYNALAEGEITIGDIFQEAKPAPVAVGEAMLDGMLAKAGEQPAGTVYTGHKPGDPEHAAADPHVIAGSGTVKIGEILSDAASRAAKDQAKSEEELKAMAVRQALSESLEEFVGKVEKIIPGYSDPAFRPNEKQSVFVRDVIKVSWPGCSAVADVFGGKLTLDDVAQGMRKVNDIVESIISKRG